MATAAAAAALSMRAVTGKPIKLSGTGERMDALEDFDPSRVAGRILGMGDIVSLVEKAATSIDREQAMRAAERMRKGQFDLTDLREQLVGMAKMGGMSGLMAMLPGVAKMKTQMAERNIDDSMLKRQMAIIDSMTPGERKHPDILKASRKKRIATGAGSKVEEVNKLLKMHRNMADMMKVMGGGKARGPMAGLAQMMGMGGGMPSPDEMAKLAEKMPGGVPQGMPGMPPTMPWRLRASGTWWRAQKNSQGSAAEAFAPSCRRRADLPPRIFREEEMTFTRSTLITQRRRK